MGCSRKILMTKINMGVTKNRSFLLITLEENMVIFKVNKVNYRFMLCLEYKTVGQLFSFKITCCFSALKLLPS